MDRIEVPFICRLRIERFRGIERLIWHPEPGVNILIGGGDVGKTTILDAIALLLSPTNTTVIVEADYWRRQVENGFCIEAVMSIPDSCEINHQTKIAWPWEWDGEELKTPQIDEVPSVQNSAVPVYCLRVRATDEFELLYELCQPNNMTDNLPVSLRRKIGLVRLSGDDRNDRDLRLIQGSALDRLISDKTLRARLGQKLADNNIVDALNEEARSNLKNLDESFQRQALPDGLGIGLIGGQGLSLNALIGLTATNNSVQLPLASWGAGTRRLAALGIANAHHQDSPITIVDEIERGLEPYRQRGLMAGLRERASQVFVTTHSATILSAASGCSLWYIESECKVGKLPSSISAHQKKDPETFLARIAIIVEGATEYGFVDTLFKKGFSDDYLQYGIWLTDASGNTATLQLLEDLVASGLKFGGFADDEGDNPQKWANIKHKLGDLLFRWSTGCLEENILKLVPVESLEEFIKNTDGDSGSRLRTLAERLEIKDKDFSAIKARATDLHTLIIEAATGKIPDNKEFAEKGEKNTFKKHSQQWFKSIEGGKELADKVFSFNLWPELEDQLLPFINAVRSTVSLPPIKELSK